MLTHIIYAAEVIGIIAFAISGAMLAADKNLDIFGILVLGIVTAFGGGVIRDLLLGVAPPAMFSSYVFLLLATLASGFVFMIYRLLYRGKIVQDKQRLNYTAIVNFFDAIGLGVFSISGVNVALENGFAANPVLSICVGVLTGIGGGMIRDVLIGEIPSVLRKHIYALAAILGASVYYVLAHTALSPLVAVLLACGLTISLRLLASYYRWHLPRPKI